GDPGRAVRADRARLEGGGAGARLEARVRRRARERPLRVLRARGGLRARARGVARVREAAQLLRAGGGRLLLEGAHGRLRPAAESGGGGRAGARVVLKERPVI